MTDILISLGAAFIGAIASIIVCIINNNKQNALFRYRLEELEKQVNKHNNMIERTYNLEKRADISDEKDRETERRLTALETEKKAG